MSVSTESAPTTKSFSKCAYWTEKDDQILVQTLLKAKNNGEQSGNGFKPSVWTTVAKALKEQSSNTIGAEKTSEKCLDH